MDDMKNMNCIEFEQKPIDSGGFCEWMKGIKNLACLKNWWYNILFPILNFRVQNIIDQLVYNYAVTCLHNLLTCDEFMENLCQYSKFGNIWFACRLQFVLN